MIIKFLLLEGKIDKLKEKYESVPIDIFNLFVKADKSNTKKYLEWMLIQYNKQTQYDFRQIINTIELYQEYENKIPRDKKDIYSMDIADLSSFMTDLLERLKVPQEREQAYSEATILLKTPQVLFLRPLTQQSSCYFGKGSQWCISATQSKNYFAEYTNDQKAFYFLFLKAIQSKADHLEEIYGKIAIEYDQSEEYTYWNAQDHTFDDESFKDAIIINLLLDKGFTESEVVHGSSFDDDIFTEEENYPKLIKILEDLGADLFYVNLDDIDELDKQQEIYEFFREKFDEYAIEEVKKYQQLIADDYENNPPANVISDSILELIKKYNDNFDYFFIFTSDDSPVSITISLNIDKLDELLKVREDLSHGEEDRIARIFHNYIDIDYLDSPNNYEYNSDYDARLSLSWDIFDSFDEDDLWQKFEKVKEWDNKMPAVLTYLRKELADEGFIEDENYIDLEDLLYQNLDVSPDFEEGEIIVYFDNYEYSRGYITYDQIEIIKSKMTEFIQSLLKTSNQQLSLFPEFSHKNNYLASEINFDSGISHDKTLLYVDIYITHKTNLNSVKEFLFFLDKNAKIIVEHAYIIIPEVLLQESKLFARFKKLIS